MGEAMTAADKFEPGNLRTSGMTFFVVISLAVALSACASREMRCSATPKLFCAEFGKLDQMLSSKDIEQLRSANESDIGAMHLGFGGEIRSSLHLWEKNDITDYFNSVGITHPDIMSGVVIRGYVAYLNGRSADMAEIAKQSVPPPPPLEPAAR
jgi:hypothetical protein